ncbi:MAG TPA: hypothetical protein DCM40_22065 [Maribacter sp.]|nr:hypothetical protein [Maribacter sp.]
MFEEMISKTFDKTGSIQYHTKMVQLSLNELRQKFPDIYVARDREYIGRQPTILDDVLGYGEDY